MTRFSIVKLWLEVITASVRLFWPSRIGRRPSSFNPRMVMLSTSTRSVSLYAPGRISILSPGTQWSSAAWIDSPGLTRNTAGWRRSRLDFKFPATVVGGITFDKLGFRFPPAAVGGITFDKLGFRFPLTGVGGIDMVAAALTGGGMAEPRALGVWRGTTGRPEGTFSGISGFFDSSVSAYRNAIRSLFSWSEILNRRILSSRFDSCIPSPLPPPFE